MPLATSLVLASLLFAPSKAPIEGVVVQVSDEEVVVNLGRAKGLLPSGELALFRRLVVTHPITGKTIEDRFPIGLVQPDQVGERLTIIRKTDHLTRPPEAGDFAVFSPPKKPPETPKLAEAKDPSPTKPTQESVLDNIFRDSLGKALPDRIKLFESYLQAFPQSQYAPTVTQEVVFLRKLQDTPKVVVTQAAPKKETRPNFTVRGQTVKSVTAGEPFDVAVAVTERERLKLVRFLVADGDSATWRTMNMRADGDYYFRSTVPADLLAEPGELSYFVEAVDTKNRLVPLWGTPRQPKTFKVNPIEPGDGPQGNSTMDISAQYVDFNTPGKAEDSYLHWEVSFAYEVDFKLFRLIRVGLGTIDGTGGDTDIIDADPNAAEQISINYAFAEGEFALTPLFGVSTRIIGGTQHQSEESSISDDANGFEGRLRFGTPEGTRLVVGGGVLEGMGSKGFTDVFIEVFENVPIRAAVTVTDLPVGANLGVQLSTQVGYRLSEVTAIHLKTGWNARTIRHYGFTGGGALSLNW